MGIYRFAHIQYMAQPISVREIAFGDKLNMYLNTYKHSSSTTSSEGVRTLTDRLKMKLYVKDIDTNKALLYSPRWHGKNRKAKFGDLELNCP